MIIKKNNTRNKIFELYAFTTYRLMSTSPLGDRYRSGSNRYDTVYMSQCGAKDKFLMSFYSGPEYKFLS